MCGSRNRKMMVHDVSYENFITTIQKNAYSSNPKSTLNDVLANIYNDFQYMQPVHVQEALQDLKILKHYEDTHGNLRIEQILEN